ncbi:leucine-rich repeat protein 1-like [Anoplophora glabripennis]|uniref:leucine-rich repeat protein 1-like n=1 Tax=Anoplophora glabripennis TaxID=217634 RepID=UPI0008748F34|nr:leucine-rich repeat protein 1-like [Anoplophora glabripennis]
MKIVCNVFVSNRLLPSLAVSRSRKHVKSTLALCKHPKSEEYCIILFSGQNKNGTKYSLKGNVKQVLTKFAHEGKCTIQFNKPEHDLFIQSDVIQLKGFLHILKRALENKISQNELTYSSMAVTPVKQKDIAPTKLVIAKRSDYPIRGFPRTLEELHINDIQRCGIDRGIINLVNLRILDLSNNWIEFIPEDLSNLTNLKEFNISHNILARSTPKQWNWMGGNLSKSLLLLDVSYNELTYIPNQICKLHKLTTLNLNNNLIKTLPAGIGNLRNLKIFSASNNFLVVLPGSIKKLRLHSIDISNNNFEQCIPNGAGVFPKPLPVCTLKEYASRKVLGARLIYFSGNLPLTLVNYLDNAKYCVCGKACFEVYLRSSHNLLLGNIAESVSSSFGDMYVPIDCYFCSLKCSSLAYQNRSRHPIVR